jgi:hypothetical protein
MTVLSLYSNEKLEIFRYLESKPLEDILEVLVWLLQQQDDEMCNLDDFIEMFEWILEFDVRE